MDEPNPPEPKKYTMTDFIETQIPIDKETLDKNLCIICNIEYTSKQGLIRHYRSQTHNHFSLPNAQKFVDDALEYLLTRKNVVTGSAQCEHCMRKFSTKYYRSLHEQKCLQNPLNKPPIVVDKN